MSIKNKTIFDFCNDTEVISFITGEKTPSQNNYVNNNDREQKLYDLSMLAFITKNDKLSLLVQKEYPYIIDWDISVFHFLENFRKKHNII